MKSLTLILALTLPIICGLDLTICNVFIACMVWGVEVVKWMNNEVI